ncbi:hypothetical protein AOLI_G00085740 [Acnodon oligacanthus]
MSSQDADSALLHPVLEDQPCVRICREVGHRIASLRKKTKQLHRRTEIGSSFTRLSLADLSVIFNVLCYYIIIASHLCSSSLFQTGDHM